MVFLNAKHLCSAGQPPWFKCAVNNVESFILVLYRSFDEGNLPNSNASVRQSTCAIRVNRTVFLWAVSSLISNAGCEYTISNIQQFYILRWKIFLHLWMILRTLYFFETRLWSFLWYVSKRGSIGKFRVIPFFSLL